jgi:DnaJ-class molecular chaperone
MPDELWRKDPDHYSEGTRCRGTGEVDCPPCQGKGMTFGPHRTLIGRTILRRMSWKECDICRGKGKLRCGICTNGSIRES